MTAQQAILIRTSDGRLVPAVVVSQTPIGQGELMLVVKPRA